MLWKLFGSEQKVQEALNQSVGYDISPASVIQTPANSDAALKKQAVDKKAANSEFYFIAPWDKDQA